MNIKSGKNSHTSKNDYRWGFLTKHAHVLLCLVHDPGARQRDIATIVGVTERSAQTILSDLVEAGYVTRERHGRRNRYEIRHDLGLRHPMAEDLKIGELLELLLKSSDGQPAVKPSGESETAF